MVQVQFAPVKSFAAILAGVLVALEDVVARELYFLFRKPVVAEQQDDARDAQAKGHCGDGFVLGFDLGKVGPLVKVIGVKAAGVIVVHHLRIASEEQAQRAPHRA